jgi:hypothetical protein
MYGVKVRKFTMSDQQGTTPQIIIKIDGDHLKLIDKELQRVHELLKSDIAEIRQLAVEQLKKFHEELQLMHQLNKTKTA